MDAPTMPLWLDIPAGARAQAMALQFQLQQTQAADPAMLRELQLAALRRLVAHAVRHVPWYREQLGHDFRLDSWARWQALPVLTRPALQAAGKRLVSEHLPPDQGRVQEVRSSGSTGTPVCVLLSERSNVYWGAFTQRDHLWHRRDLGGRVATIKHQAPGEALLPGKQAPDWGGASAAIFANGPSFLLNSSVPVADQFRWLLEVRPDYLLTYPSLVLELAKLNDAAGRPLRLRGLSTLGEMLLPHQRAAGEASFGARLCDMYSSQEIGYMAMQCPRHNHYHVMSEGCLLEILDDNDQPCPPGTAGRVVVTPLHNYAQPLLRYAVGDHAIAGEGCDCGIRLPVLKQVLGRTRNLAIRTDGSKFWPAYQPTKLMALIPNAQFQVAQTGPGQLELRVLVDGDLDEETAAQARTAVRGGMGEDFTVEVRRVEALPRSKGGKYEEFICEWQPG